MTFGPLNPGDLLVARMQNRRGNRVNLPQPLASGELGWCVDTKQLFIGLDSDSALPIVELHQTGNISMSQASVNDVLDGNIIEFQSKWIALNMVTSVVGKTEEEVLVELRNLSSSAYVEPQNQTFINEYEADIDILNRFENGIVASIPPAFTSTTFITYDYVVRDDLRATVNITDTGTLVGIPAIIDAGLGYRNGEVVSVVNQLGSGIGATFTVTVVDDGQGKIASLSLTSGGSGYVAGTHYLASPNRVPMIATATATQTAGIITLVSLGIGGLEYDKIPTVTITDSTGVGAVITANLTGRSVSGFNIVSGGSGYTAPTITISAPKSNTFYKFRYDVAVGDVPSGTVFDQVTHLAPTLIALNALPDAVYTGGAALLIDQPTYAADVLGTGGYGLYMADSEVAFTTVKQSSNVAALINAVAPAYSTGLVVTKQNVEIVTEETIGDAQFPSDLYFAGLTPVTLVDTAGVWSNTGLTYNVDDNNVQMLNFSLSLVSATPALSYTAAGTITIATSEANGVTNSSMSYTEARDTATGVFSFRTTYAYPTITLQYKHDFGEDLKLKITSQRWLSF